MLFNSYPFALFLSVLLPTYWLAPKSQRSNILIAASLLFYGMWIPQYILLLLIELAVNYVFLLGITRSARPRLYLSASIVFSVGLLAYFKYAAFLIDSLVPILRFSGFPPVKEPHVLLPLGISFFTFQLLGLAIDGYRSRGLVVRSFSEYVLFITFFPQLIAGPILRGWELLPELRRGGWISAERLQRASWLITAGLMKKVVFADALLAPYVNAVFTSPGYASAPEHLLAAYSFAYQIYFDFSGYTDIARGIALLLGFEITLNFKEPYLSRDPSEFWRRWHITLSRWLRDYLYIPLGGNRGRPSRVYLNLFLTMLLGGLWHGAGWNFVIWGTFHGLLLIGHRLATKGRQDAERPLSAKDIPRIVLLFNAVCILWVFFRAATFNDALAILDRILTGSYAGTWPVFQCLVVATCAVAHPIERLARLNTDRLREITRRPVFAVAESALIGVAIGVVVILGGFGGEFIYFQF